MDQVSPTAYRLPIALLAALAVTSLVAVTFYGWVSYGSSILLTLAETGLSNCF
jgi:hypothetical protein